MKTSEAFSTSTPYHALLIDITRINIKNNLLKYFCIILKVRYLQCFIEVEIYYYKLEDLIQNP